MHDFAKDLLVALMVGAEVFAIAALWPLSDWAVSAPRRAGFVVALVAIAACVVLCALGILPPAVSPGSWRWRIGELLGWAPLPLFMALPDAVCVASGQSLARAGVPARYARTTALFMGAVAVVVAPVATLAAGCGLAGACF
jgi:hypothetical protein